MSRSRLITRRRFISGRLFHNIYFKSHVSSPSDLAITIEFLSTGYTQISFEKNMAEEKFVARRMFCACTRRYHIVFEKSNLFIDTFAEAI